MTKGDRVVIRHPDAGPLFHNAHGIVTRAREKRPRGKTPGIWVNVRIDPRPGLKKAEIEIHSDHVQLEVTTSPYAGEKYPNPCPTFGAEHTMEGFACVYCDGHGAGYDKAVSLGKRGRDVLDLAIRENTRMKRLITAIVDGAPCTCGYTEDAHEPPGDGNDSLPQQAMGCAKYEPKWLHKILDDEEKRAANIVAETAT